MTLPPDDVTFDDEIEAAGEPPMPLSRRLRQPRTIISIVIPLAVIAVFVALNGDQLGRVPGLIARVDCTCGRVFRFGRPGSQGTDPERMSLARRRTPLGRRCRLRRLGC